MEYISNQKMINLPRETLLHILCHVEIYDVLSLYHSHPQLNWLKEMYYTQVTKIDKDTYILTTDIFGQEVGDNYHIYNRKGRSYVEHHKYVDGKRIKYYYERNCDIIKSENLVIKNRLDPLLIPGLEECRFPTLEEFTKEIDKCKDMNTADFCQHLLYNIVSRNTISHYIFFDNYIDYSRFVGLIDMLLSTDFSKSSSLAIGIVIDILSIDQLLKIANSFLRERVLVSLVNRYYKGELEDKDLSMFGLIDKPREILPEKLYEAFLLFPPCRISFSGKMCSSCVD